MRERFFYKADGSRQKVTLSEYSRRKKIQRKALERSGKQVWEDRRGRQTGVSPERLEQLQRKRHLARAGAEIGWDTVGPLVKAAKSESGRVRTYPGPTMEIRSSIDEGIFHAALLDAARLAIEIEDRPGELYVSAFCQATVFSPDEPGGEPGNSSWVPLFTVEDRKISRHSKDEAVAALGRLNKGIKGVEKKSPKKQDPSAEVVPGKLIEAPAEQEEDKGPRFAEPGYYGVYRSEITVRGVKR